MKQKIFVLGVLIALALSVMRAEANSQDIVTEKKKGPSNLLQANKEAPKFPDLGLRIGLDKTGEILRITGKGTVRGQSLTQTSRTNKDVFKWIVMQKPHKLHFEIVYINEDDTVLLEQLPDLEEITLVNTNVGERTIQHLSKIKSLKRISIINGNITDRSIFIFAQMTGLEYLTLDRNRFLPGSSDRLLRKLLPRTKVKAL